MIDTVATLAASTLSSVLLIASDDSGAEPSNRHLPRAWAV
jgi:hypothetical protein